MSSRTRFAISALIILAGSAVIWFLGWLVWGFCDLWNYLQNYEYQHLLLLMMSAWIVAGLVRARPHRNPENTEAPLIKEVQQQPKNNPHPTSDPDPDIKALSAKVDELLEKQTDVQAVMRFFKTREQIDSLRRPIQKSEIKIEIPEDVAETLKPKKPSPKHTHTEKEGDDNA